MRHANLLCAATSWLALAGCSDKAKFPDQIPGIVATLGIFHTSFSARDRIGFDSVCSDRELFDELVTVLGPDSLAVLTRRIHNPIDSAYIIMTVARYVRSTQTVDDRYQLELFMHREEDRYWIVAHRLTHSLP